MNGPAWWQWLMKGETLYLHCDDLKDLIRCQWPISPRVFLGFRVVSAAVMFLYFLISLSISIMSSKVGFKYFIYLTNWAYILLTVTYITKAFNVMLNMPALTSSSSAVKVRNPLLIKVSWLLSNVSTSMAFMVTVIFWTLISGVVPKHYLYSISNINDHCLNSVWAFLDLVLCAHPVRLLHVYQPLCITVLYGCFSVLYYVAGGLDIFNNPYIYGFLDWSKPQQTLLFGILPCGVALVGFYVLVWSIAQLRQWFYRKLYTTSAPRCYTEEMDNNDVSEPEKDSLLQSTV